MIQFAWRFLRFQPASELNRWYRGRTEGVIDARKPLRKKLIVALARKLLVPPWRLVTTGELPAGLLLPPPPYARRSPVAIGEPSAAPRPDQTRVGKRSYQ